MTDAESRTAKWALVITGFIAITMAATVTGLIELYRSLSR